MTRRGCRAVRTAARAAHLRRRCPRPVASRSRRRTACPAGRRRATDRRTPTSPKADPDDVIGPDRHAAADDHGVGLREARDASRSRTSSRRSTAMPRSIGSAPASRTRAAQSRAVRIGDAGRAERLARAPDFVARREDGDPGPAMHTDRPDTGARRERDRLPASSRSPRREDHRVADQVATRADGSSRPGATAACTRIAAGNGPDRVATPGPGRSAVAPRVASSLQPARRRRLRAGSGAPVAIRTARPRPRTSPVGAEPAATSPPTARRAGSSSVAPAVSAAAHRVAVHRAVVPGREVGPADHVCREHAAKRVRNGDRLRFGQRPADRREDALTAPPRRTAAARPPAPAARSSRSRHGAPTVPRPRAWMAVTMPRLVSTPSSSLPLSTGSPSKPVWRRRFESRPTARRRAPASAASAARPSRRRRASSARRSAGSGAAARSRSAPGASRPASPAGSLPSPLARYCAANVSSVSCGDTAGRSRSMTDSTLTAAQEASRARRAAPRIARMPPRSQPHGDEHEAVEAVAGQHHPDPRARTGPSPGRGSSWRRRAWPASRSPVAAHRPHGGPSAVERIDRQQVEQREEEVQEGDNDGELRDRIADGARRSPRRQRSAP